MITEELRKNSESKLSMEALPETESAPARELAEEALQTLVPFVAGVHELCLSVGERLWSGEDVAQDFTRLMDGIEILVDAVQTARIILNVESHPVTESLHRELVGLLTQLEISMRSEASNTLEQRVELLRDLLPGNLNNWVISGIPSLIRSRDS